MNTKEKYARLAKIAYTHDPDEIKKLGFIKDGNFSNKQSIILVNDNEVVYSVRGSVDIVEDWVKTDPLILFGLLPSSARYKREKSKLLRVYDRYNRPITLVGHSLGGSLAYHLTLQLPKLIEHAYCYNLGFSPEDLKKRFWDQAVCLLTPGSEDGGPGGLAPRCTAFNKITIYRETVDLVSLPSIFIQDDSQRSKNNPILAHLIDNFTGVGGDFLRDLHKSQMEPKILQFIKDYCPIFYFKHGEDYFPTSVQEFAKHCKIVKRGRDTLLELAQPLSGPYEMRPEFKGMGPNGNAPCYVFVLRNSSGSYFIRFMHFYAYNYGKKVMGTLYGNHVGDWEGGGYFLNPDLSIKQVVMKQHHFYHTLDYNKDFEKEGKRPLLYYAEDSHGVMNYPGKSTYKKVKPLFELVDYTGKDIRYDPLTKPFVIMTNDNLLGKDDTAMDINGSEVSLALPNLGIKNWSHEIDYMGNPSIGKVDIPFSKSQYKLSGHIRNPGDFYKKKLQNGEVIRR